MSLCIDCQSRPAIYRSQRCQVCRQKHKYLAVIAYRARRVKLGRTRRESEADVEALFAKVEAQKRARKWWAA